MMRYDIDRAEKVSNFGGENKYIGKGLSNDQYSISINSMSG